MKESKFNNNFVDAMKIKFPHLWGHKFHGHEMQASSIPDNLFCINGLFLAIEFKVQRDYAIQTTPMQLKEIFDIFNSNGIALLIAYDENNNRICINTKRIDYKKYIGNKAKIVSTKKISIKLDWDFEFKSYEDAVDFIYYLIEQKGR